MKKLWLTSIPISFTGIMQYRHMVVESSNPPKLSDIVNNVGQMKISESEMKRLMETLSKATDRFTGCSDAVYVIGEVMFNSRYALYAEEATVIRLED